jgi:hypothetical protein
VVRAQKPFIEQKIDRTIVNIAGSITATGSSAWEVLQKLPGVAVDNSSNTVSLQGKSGVTIYIDGKPTYLSGEQLANMLKSMNAGTIQSIEVMPHPPTSYDAEGNAGVINILTKRSKMKGFNGTLTAGYSQGRYPRGNIGTDLNYRTGKFNVFGTYSFTDSRGWMETFFDRRFYNAGSIKPDITASQYDLSIYKERSHDFKAGIDYNLNERNALGLLVHGIFMPTSSQAENNTTRFLNAGNQPDSIALTKSALADHWSSMTYDLNFKHDFDSAGNSLSVDLALSRFDFKRSQGFETNKYHPDGTMIEGPGIINPYLRNGSMPAVIDIKTAKVDYVKALTPGLKLEAGLKVSYVSADNDVHYRIFLDNKWQTDLATTNHFNYKEHINAGYLNFGGQRKNGWTWQLGLRGEQTISKGHQYINDSTVERNYFQLFPTLFIQKEYKDQHVFGFTYNRRIGRPDYQDLNPFLFYLDPYTYNVGNPFLQPQLANSFEVSYAYQKLVVTSLSYTHTSNILSTVVRQNDTTLVTYQTKDNLSQNDNLTLNISLNIPVTAWWMSNNTIVGLRNMFNGSYLGTPLSLQRNTILCSSTNTFTLSREWKAECSGTYRSPMLSGLFDLRSQYIVDAGIQRSVLKGNGTVKLGVNDIFHSNIDRVAMKYGNVDAYVKNRSDTRRFNLSFTWRFIGKGGTIHPRDRSATDEEQSRIRKN